jgi:hypothetical protein
MEQKIFLQQESSCFPDFKVSGHHNVRLWLLQDWCPQAVEAVIQVDTDDALVVFFAQFAV